MDFFIGLFGFILSGIIVAFVGLHVVSWLTPWPKRSRNELQQPLFVYNTNNVNVEQFATLLDDSSGKLRCTEPDLYLSVIIPALNEEKRLPVMLDECLPYLEERQIKDKSFSFEVIIVDDGSTDRTADIGCMYTKQREGKVRVLRLEKNLGKGGAVRYGVLHARGSLILFADADGATKFSDLDRLEENLIQLTTLDGFVLENRTDFDWTLCAVVVGSRAHMEEESIATRSLARTFLMIAFHFMVFIFTVKTVRDTQCGFKLFTRAAASKLFPLLHIERWAFDVELLFLAEKLNIPIREVPVSWHEVDGSKIVPVLSWIQMGRDLILIWFRYATGVWKFDLQ